MTAIFIYINQILWFTKNPSFILNSVLTSFAQIAEYKEWNQNISISELTGGPYILLPFLLL